MTNDEQLLLRFRKALSFAQIVAMCLFSFAWNAVAFPTSGINAIPYLAGMAVVIGLVPIGIQHLFILFVMIMAEDDDSG